MPILLMALGWGRSALGAIFAFCSKPPGSWIAAAVAFALGIWWYGQHEFNKGKEACEKAHANAAANEIIRVKTVYIDADARSAQRTDKSETVNAKNRTIVRVIHDQAAAMPDHDATCIPADIADRLREIK